MMNTVKFVAPFSIEPMEGIFKISAYADNGRIAIQLYARDAGTRDIFEPFSPVTVNLPKKKISHPDYAFVDVNNSFFIESILLRYGIAYPTGRIAASGYCVYPEYVFSMKELRKYTMDKVNYDYN